jgi:hypothetical protein
LQDDVNAKYAAQKQLAEVPAQKKRGFNQFKDKIP